MRRILSLLCLGGLLLLSRSASSAVPPIQIIIAADSLGATIVSLDEAERDSRTCDRASLLRFALEGALEEFPAEARGELERLVTTEQVTLVADLEDTWEPRAWAFTNIEPDEPRCPRIFFHGTFIWNANVARCRKVAVLLKELVHAKRFIDGTVSPAFMNAAIETVDDVEALLDEETRGYLAQGRYALETRCTTDAYDRAYLSGGLPELRRTILRQHNLYSYFPDQRYHLECYARWISP